MYLSSNETSSHTNKAKYQDGPLYARNGRFFSLAVAIFRGQKANRCYILNTDGPQGNVLEHLAHVSSSNPLTVNIYYKNYQTLQEDALEC